MTADMVQTSTTPITNVAVRMSALPSWRGCEYTTLWSLVALSLTTSRTATTLGATMSDSRYGADAHNTDYERGREDERAAIGAWLLGNGLLHIAYTIESGEPLAGDDE